MNIKSVLLEVKIKHLMNHYLKVENQFPQKMNSHLLDFYYFADEIALKSLAKFPSKYNKLERKSHTRQLFSFDHKEDLLL